MNTEQRNLPLLFTSFFKTLRGTTTLQLGILSAQTILTFSRRTLERFLSNHAPVPTTPPTEQTLPPGTPRTRRRAEIRDANNILTESPDRRRRRPIAPALPTEPPPPSPRFNIPLPAQRHLLARQPLNPSMNVAHSLGPMNEIYISLFLSFSY